MTILSIGAHIDDNENGMGGILIKAVEAGHRVVVVVAVSDYSTWGHSIGREEQCKKDQLDLAERFGYEKRFLDYPYHQLMPDVELKKKIAEIYLEVKPAITFVMNTEDHFPDHANSGIAAKDAVLFSHGYTENRKPQRCPRVLAYNSTPHQTIRFEPDLYFDVTDVMPKYMELLKGTDYCLQPRPESKLIRYEVKDLLNGLDLKLGYHGWAKFLQCATWGDGPETKGKYAIGLKTLWGPKDGSPLW